MNHIALAVTTTALTLATSACAPQSPGSAPASSTSTRGKPSAPVSVSAQLSGGSGRVTVRFDADAKDVRVEVHGVDGLAVTSSAVPLDHATFELGQTAAFDIAFTPGPGRSYVAVAVTGKFRGAGKRAAVTSFAVGEPTPEQRQAGGTVIEGNDGRVKIVVPGK